MSSDPSRKDRSTLVRQFALAMELPFTLAAGVFLGAAGGYLLDRWWHSFPVATIILAFLGFGAGLRDALRRLAAEEKREEKDDE